MLNRYIGSQFKRLLIPGIIFTAILSIFAFSFASGLDLTFSAYEYIDDMGVVRYWNYAGNYIFGTRVSSQITSFSTVCVIAAFILPFITFSYRSSLKKADLVYQAPFKEGTIKRVRVLVSLIYLVLAVTTAFIFMYFISLVKLTGLKYDTFTGVIESKGYSSYKYMSQYYKTFKATINFGALFSSYIILIITCIVTYTITSFFVSRCTATFNSILVTLCGYVLLGLFLYGAIKYFDDLYSAANEIYEASDALKLGFSPVHMILNINYIFEYNIFVPSSYYFENDVDAIYLIDFIVTTLLGVGAFIIVLFEKEPSGEYFGKPDTKSPLQRFIFHGAMGTIGFLLFTNSFEGSGITTFFIVYMFFGAVYFLLIAWFNRSFRFKIKDLVPFVTIMVMSLITPIIYNMLYNYFEPPHTIVYYDVKNSISLYIVGK